MSGASSFARGTMYGKRIYCYGPQTNTIGGHSSWNSSHSGDCDIDEDDNDSDDDTEDHFFVQSALRPKDVHESDTNTA